MRSLFNQQDMTVKEQFYIIGLWLVGAILFLLEYQYTRQFHSIYVIIAAMVYGLIALKYAIGIPIKPRK